MLRPPFLTASIVAALLTAGTAATAETAIPIHQIRLHLGRFGLPIYGIPVRVGGTMVEAGLDTGSVGLRVMARALRPGDARPAGSAETYTYSSGVTLPGQAGATRLAFGDHAGAARIQLIETVGCVETRQDCPGKGNPADYRVEGRGIAHAGFLAIAGLRLPRQRPDSIDNPLVETGARGYVIDLPRLGEPVGRLAIDPGPRETRGFVKLPNAHEVFPNDPSVRPTTVPGCILNKDTGREICGTILFDTGAPGIEVTLPSPATYKWDVGTASRLVLGDGRKHEIATEEFIAGPMQNSSVSFTKPNPRLERASISIGVTPFFAFSVLYQPHRHGIAIRPRPPAPDGPIGRLAGSS